MSQMQFTQSSNLPLHRPYNSMAKHDNLTRSMIKIVIESKCRTEDAQLRQQQIKSLRNTGALANNDNRYTPRRRQTVPIIPPSESVSQVKKKSARQLSSTLLKVVGMVPPRILVSRNNTDKSWDFGPFNVGMVPPRIVSLRNNKDKSLKATRC